MAGSLVPIYVVESWARPDSTSPTGLVTFDLLGAIESPEYVTPTRELAALSAGAIAQQLYALDADSLGDPLVPSTLQYRVVEEILGADSQEYFITVPAVPPGSRTVNDGVVVQNTPGLTSASAAFTQDDVGAYLLLPQVPPGTTIQSVTNSAHAVMSMSASASAVGVAVMVGASASLSEMRYPE